MGPIRGPEVLLASRVALDSSRSGARLRAFQWQLSLVMVLAIAVASLKEQCLCNQQFQDDQQQQQLQQQQQQEQRQQQQRATEQSSSIDQVPNYGGEYSALIEDSLVNLGQPLFNGKRARKMSGFMPMRGRKDGRDQQQQLEQRFYLPLLQAEEIIAGNPFRDTDEDSNILRIVAGSGSAPAELRWIKQGHFANQFAAHHLLASGENRGGQRAGPFVGETLESSPDSGQQSVLVVGNSRMQAKLRRAFHPMRGKKSYASAQLTEPRYADELQLMDST